MRAEIAQPLLLNRLARRVLGRREFVRRSCCAASALGIASQFGRFGAINALAQSSGGYKALVCLFLYGGNDSNNMLIPLDQAGYRAYSSSRGSLALSQSSLLPIAPGSQPGPFGLHPSLPNLQALFNQQRLAILATSGFFPLLRAKRIFLPILRYCRAICSRTRISKPCGKHATSREILAAPAGVAGLLTCYIPHCQ